MTAAALDRAWSRSLVVLGAIALATSCVLIPIYRVQGLPWPHAVAAALIVVVPGAALSWGVWRFAATAHALAAHLVAASAFSLAWPLSIVVLAYAVHPSAARAFFHNGAVWQTFGSLIVYIAITATAQAWRTQARLRERELVATDAELQALRAQLNPHFLFNTLHSLTQLAREDPAATEDALERFGELMRYVLNAGRNGAGTEVALEEELGFLRNYLALEHLRLGERLRVVEAVAEETRELGLPPLLLQPLVENAMRHGIAPRQAGGTIRIGAETDGDTLQLEIADDGIGAEPAAWQCSKGFGLAVVRRQLATRFPAEGSFEVTSQPSSGFTVRLRLPAHLPARTDVNR